MSDKDEFLVKNFYSKLKDGKKHINIYNLFLITQMVHLGNDHNYWIREQNNN